MPRFVILEHDHPTLHWDLMLESGAVLRTWRLDRPPRAGEPLMATAVFDHRLFYLDYEGPIRGGRGSVIRRESGTFHWRTETDSRIEVHLKGGRLRGLLRLKQGEGACWTGEFVEDSDAR